MQVVIEASSSAISQWEKKGFPVFFSHAYGSELKLLKFKEDAEVIAVMWVWESGKKFLNSLITPPFLPNCWLTFLNEYDKPATKRAKEKEVLKALLSFVESEKWAYWKFDFPVEYTDFQEAIWKGTIPKTKYTYRILSLRNWEERIDSKLRNKLKRFSDFSFEVRSFTDAEVNLLMSSSSSRGVAHENLLAKFNAMNSPSAFTVIAEGGEYQAFCAIVGGVCYYLVSSNAKNDNALSACGVKFCIEESIRRGCFAFDFEGSMIPEIEVFFRSFGGDLLPYFSIEGGKGFPYLLRKLLK
jgi:hypothetical protein